MRSWFWRFGLGAAESCREMAAKLRQTAVGIAWEESTAIGPPNALGRRSEARKRAAIAPTAPSCARKPSDGRGLVRRKRVPWAERVKGSNKANWPEKETKNSEKNSQEQIGEEKARERSCARWRVGEFRCPANRLTKSGFGPSVGTKDGWMGHISALMYQYETLDTNNLLRCP